MKIGEIKVETGSGIETLPIYEEGDSGSSVREYLKVETESGTGFIPIVDPGSSDRPYIRINTYSNSVQSLHSEPSLVKAVELGEEEDGDASEWSGETGFISAVTSPTVSNSSYALQMYTDGNERSVTKSIPGISKNTYNYFSFYIYMHNDSNNEFNMWDGGIGGNQVFGLYFRPNNNTGHGEGVYWSSESSRTSGTKILDGSNFGYNQWYHIEYRNIDYSNNQLDIYINGNFKGTYNFIEQGGQPDTFYLDTNMGGSASPTFSIDRIKGKDK